MGTFEWNHNKKYTGKWYRNQMHGLGICEWSDKRRYEGEYVHGKKEGYGIYKWYRIGME